MEIEQPEISAPVRVAVYGFIKDEQPHLPRFLASVQEADEIVLCDTGASKQTHDMIMNFKLEHPEVPLKIYTLHISPWRFDDARNTALAFVSPDIDLCLALDMNEYVPVGWKDALLRSWDRAATRYSHYVRITRANGETMDRTACRIHLRKGYMWKLPIMERLDYRGEERIVALPDFWILRDEAAVSSDADEIALLQQALREQKDHWPTWSHLAEAYARNGQFTEAMNALDSALKLETSDKPLLYKQKYGTYVRMGQHDLAMMSLSNAIFLAPERRELRVEKARLLRQLNRHAEAWYALKEAEALTLRVIDDLYDRTAWDESFGEMKAVYYELAAKEASRL